MKQLSHVREDEKFAAVQSERRFFFKAFTFQNQIQTFICVTQPPDRRHETVA